MHGVHIPAHDLPEGEGSVIPRANFAAGGFDSGDGGGGGTGDDDMEGVIGRKGFLACSEEFDAVFRAGDATRLV